MKEIAKWIAFTCIWAFIVWAGWEELMSREEHKIWVLLAPICTICLAVMTVAAIMKRKGTSRKTWNVTYDVAKWAYIVCAAPMVFLVGVSVAVWCIFGIGIKWLAALNAVAAFVAALGLTLKRHGYQAFLMWMAFFFFAFGAWNIDTVQLQGHSVQVNYEIPTHKSFLFPYQETVKLISAYWLMILSSVCFALYSKFERLTVPLWLVAAIFLGSFVAVESHKVFELYDVAVGVMYIVDMYLLGESEQAAFLICFFYAGSLLMTYCALPAAVEGWRIAVQTSRAKISPVIVGSVWLLLHILLFAGAWLLLCYNQSIEISCIRLSKVIFEEVGQDLQLSSTYLLTPLISMLGSWLIYRYVADNR